MNNAKFRLRVGFVSILPAFLACATPTSAPIRTVANVDDTEVSPLVRCRKSVDRSERRFCLLIEKDMLEAFGFMVDHTVLQTQWDAWNLREDRKERGSTAPWSSFGLRGGSGLGSVPHLLSLVAGHAGAAAVINFLGYHFASNDPNSSLRQGNPLKTGALVGVNMVSATIAASALLDVMDHTESSGGASGSSVSANSNAFIRKKDYLAEDDKPRQAFEENVRSVSKELAEKTAIVFRLLETEKLMLKRSVETEITRQASAIGGLGQFTKELPEIKLDIVALLGQDGIDVKPKIAAIAELAKKAPPIYLQCVSRGFFNQASEILRSIEGGLTRTIDDSLKFYRDLDGKDDPRFAEVMQTALAEAHRVELFREKIRLHLTYMPKR